LGGVMLQAALSYALTNIATVSDTATVTAALAGKHA
jgi:hypothetical protein